MLHVELPIYASNSVTHTLRRSHTGIAALRIEWQFAKHGRLPRASQDWTAVSCERTETANLTRSVTRQSSRAPPIFCLSTISVQSICIVRHGTNTKAMVYEEDSTGISKCLTRNSYPASGVWSRLCSIGIFRKRSCCNTKTRKAGHPGLIQRICYKDC